MFVVDSNSIPSFAKCTYLGKPVKRIIYNGDVVWNSEVDFAFSLTNGTLRFRLMKQNLISRGIRIWVGTPTNTTATITSDTHNEIVIENVTGEWGLKNYWTDDVIVRFDQTFTGWHDFNLNETVAQQSVTLTQGVRFDAWYRMCQNSISHNLSQPNHITFHTISAFTVRDEYDEPYEYAYRDWGGENTGTTYSNSVGDGRTDEVAKLPCYAWCIFETNLPGQQQITISDWYLIDVAHRTWYYKSVTEQISYVTYNVQEIA